MSLSPNTNSDFRILVPITGDTENTDGQTSEFTRSNRHLHPPLNFLDPHSQTSPTSASSHQLGELENSFFFQRPPQLPLPTFDEIAPHTVPSTEPPAMPQVVPADDLDAESQDDDTDASTYREIQAKVDQICRTRRGPSMLTERRVLKTPRVRKHHSSSARRERRIRSRSRSSDMDILGGTGEMYSRQQRLGGHIPMREGSLQEETGSYQYDRASGSLASVPEIRVECAGESKPVTPPKIVADTGRMDWCQQTPPHQTCLEEYPMDWSGNSLPHRE